MIMFKDFVVLFLTGKIYVHLKNPKQLFSGCPIFSYTYRVFHVCGVVFLFPSLCIVNPVFILALSVYSSFNNIR